MFTHSLRRTSPKGQDFVGVCVNCGTPNLKAFDATKECPNQRGVTHDQSIIDAIKGDEGEYEIRIR